LVPLMIVSATSYFISSHFENKSIYTLELQELKNEYEKNAEVVG